MKETLQNKLKENLKYRVPAILLCIALIIGLLVNRDALSQMRSVGRDVFWMCFFQILAFILVVQFLFIKFLGKVKNSSKICCSVIGCNLLSLLLTFTLFTMFRSIFPHFMEHSFIEFINWIIDDLFWPAGMVWMRHSLFYTTTFAVLTTVIATPLLYFSLRNDTKSKKLLFVSTLLSCAICYTRITIFFHIWY